MKNETIGERARLIELTTSPVFVDFIDDPQLMKAVHWIRKVGNLAAHDGRITRSDSFFTVLNLYNLVGGILLKLGAIKTLAPFDKNLLPKGPTCPTCQTSPEAFADAVPEPVVKAAHKVKPAISWDGISEYFAMRQPLIWLPHGEGKLCYD